MMTVYLLRSLLVAIGMVIIQIIYTTVAYRQKAKLQWVKFAGGAFLTVVIVELILLKVQLIYSVPFIGSIVKGLDSWVQTFFNFLPKKTLIAWLVFPLAIAWAYFLLSSILAFLSKRGKFKNWVRKHESDTNNTPLVTKKEESKSNDLIEKAESNFEDKEPEIEIPVNSVLDITTVGGLTDAYNKSKQEGLLISKIENQYVAIYSDAAGFNKLKQLLLDIQVEVSNLKPRPSLVTFTDKIIAVKSVREELEFLKTKPIESSEQIKVTKDFLDIPMSDFKYDNQVDLRNAYNLALEKGAQITKSENGYVAIYANGEGFKTVKQLLSRHSLDISCLIGKPSLVYFDDEKVSSKLVSSLLASMKGE